MKLKQLLPTRSAIAHLRFVFSLFLFPVFLFALSQTPVIHLSKTILVFFIWHFLAFPASNGYNSYFDRDEQSIALLKTPPKVDISLYYFSLFIEMLAFVLALYVDLYFAFAVLLYGVMSKLYSHPRTRLKKYPIGSFLVVFFFQGAFIYWSTHFALNDASPLEGWNNHLLIAGAICSCLIGASYPLTQVYQHKEDRSRGDRTLSILLGYKGSFIFSSALFAAGLYMVYLYWKPSGNLHRFYLFLACAAPIFLFFNYWFFRVGQSRRNANYTNAMIMNFLSAICMIAYFGWLVWVR
ncbi:MAG: UbiA family prenyltransferase [Bacteroidota bacterium]